jgi:SnoaL-like protein
VAAYYWRAPEFLDVPRHARAQPFLAIPNPAAMTRDEASRFATAWAEHWNNGEVEKVLAHFSDDTVFTSPTAAEVVGTAIVRGKDALRTYWTIALQRIGSVRTSAWNTFCGTKAAANSRSSTRRRCPARPAVFPRTCVSTAAI